MKTMSEKLRALARKPMVSSWNDEDFYAWEIADDWRVGPYEQFADLLDEEWGMFLYFVAEALETQ